MQNKNGTRPIKYEKDDCAIWRMYIDGKLISTKHIPQIIYTITDLYEKQKVSGNIVSKSPTYQIAVYLYRSLTPRFDLMNHEAFIFHFFV